MRMINCFSLAVCLGLILLVSVNCSVIGRYPASGASECNPTEAFDVVIIGGGVAGLSAAARLYKDHKIRNFTIIEAKPRIGGRVFTVHDSGKDGEFLEMGAEFIHGEVRNSVYQYAKPFGLIAPSQEQRPGEWYHMNGVKVSPAIVEEIDRVYRQLRREVEYDRDITTSVGNAMKEKFEKWIRKNMNDAPIKRALFYYKYMDECLAVSADIDRVSIDQDLNFVDASGHQQHVAENGIGAIFEHLTSELPLHGSNMLHLNSVVKKINWDSCCAPNERRVAVELTNGCVIAAKQAIVTLPLGVLKAKTVEFNPVLPQWKQTAIQRLGYGCVNKIYLIFERAWWPKNSQVNALFVDVIPDGVKVDEKLYDNFNATWYKNLVTFNSVYGHPLALEAWLTGVWAEVVERLPIEEISRVADQILKRAFSKQFDVETPVRVVRTNWCCDPYSRGGVSYVAVDAHATDFELLSKALPEGSDSRLFFAGEATSETQWSTIHGAWDSGISAANQVAQALKYRKAF